jgi:hypothetical protein
MLFLQKRHLIFPFALSLSKDANSGRLPFDRLRANGVQVTSRKKYREAGSTAF